MRRLAGCFFLLAIGCSEPGGPADAGPDVACGTCAANSHCEVVEGDATCVCDAGFHAVGDACERDTECTASTCNGHGTCELSSGVPTCTCESGFAGDACDACADGYFPDGEGGCSLDPCTPNPCAGNPERQRCEVTPEGPRCACNAGTHEEGDGCVADTTCLPTSCSGHGACSDAEGIVCTCDEGWAGAYCDACDAENGFHPDGAGGCTTDLCVPNPCTIEGQTVCAIEGETTRCDCDAGYHRDGSACIPDETCASDRCGGRGTCSIVDGVAVCACDPGYEGGACESCAAGYHDDGAGGCTDDACTPSPCTTPGRTVCSGEGVCGCDPGLHEDGVGGCTADPCRPDPCVASNQACRDAGGTAECYTPACDDGEPCTVDELVGGSCRFTPRTNGSGCSTSICMTGETCSAGVCGGGASVVCNDGNACTRDSCDPAIGCRAVNDDTLVPDDSVACTVDTCSGGLARHTVNHGACDDGRYCTGEERCTPTGCANGPAPRPPGPSSPCRYYGACDDATRSFPVFTLSGGASCDDGLVCTSGDQCVTTGGACAGTAIASCPPPVCSTTTSWPGAIDLPAASVTGTITLNGAAVPSTLAQPTSWDIDLYAVSRDTGARHPIAFVEYVYQSTGTHTLRAGSDRIATRLVPGVYDILYRRGETSTAGLLSLTPASDPFAHGLRTLRTDVVIGPGDNVLDVDVPAANVTGTIRLNNAAMPGTLTQPTSWDVDLYAVSRDTGARHPIAFVEYVYQSSGTHTLRTGSDRIATRLVPGVYDILYRRGETSTAGLLSLTPASDPFAHGLRTLTTGVVIAPGENTLDVNLPAANVTGTVRLNNAAMPGTLTQPTSWDVDLYAVSHDTGARHPIAFVEYVYQSTGTHTLRAGSDAIATRLVPGTYDILYRRGETSTAGLLSLTPASDPFAHGLRTLMTDVVIGPGDNTLDVNLPAANVTGTITLNGGAMPGTLTQPTSWDVDLYAVSRDTGARHPIAFVEYVYQSSGTHTLRAGSDTIATRLVPGVYDILYRRGETSTEGLLSLTPASDPFAHGLRVLGSGVVIAPGNNTLNVDLPSSRVTGNITLNGAALPATLTQPTSWDVDLYAVSRDTGARHPIAFVEYVYQSNGAHTLRAGSNAIDTRLVPGTYDILYRRGETSTEGLMSLTPPSDPFAHGLRVLISGVVIGSGPATLNVDLPAAPLASPITLNGEPLPATLTQPTSWDVDLYAVSRDTGARHPIAFVEYVYQSTGTHTLRAGSGAVATRLVPGTYDLLYRRGETSTAGLLSLTDPTDPFAHGLRTLGACWDVR
jgi:hypothetical protein